MALIFLILISILTHRQLLITNDQQPISNFNYEKDIIRDIPLCTPYAIIGYGLVVIVISTGICKIIIIIVRMHTV